jgi:hypothetical protein
MKQELGRCYIPTQRQGWIKKTTVFEMTKSSECFNIFFRNKGSQLESNMFQFTGAKVM